MKTEDLLFCYKNVYLLIVLPIKGLLLDQFLDGLLTNKTEMIVAYSLF